MAQLKLHMLREVASTLFGPDCFRYISKRLPTLEKFVLSGKEPIRVFCQVVACDITITDVTSNSLRVLYRGKSWWHKPSLLDVLMVKFARKVHMDSFRWVYESTKLGYLKIMAENTGFEELRIDHKNRFYHWPKILKAFPNLAFLRVTAQNFALMLSAAPAELAYLKEIALTRGNKANELLAAHKALSEHQKKLHSLDTIYYVYTPLKDIAFPDDANNILSVKHLKVLAKIDCCTPFNFSFLTAAQKTFPRLESVEINANTLCDCINIPRKLKFLTSFYAAFESLNLEFAIKVAYNETFTCFEKDTDRLRQFFATQGKVYEGPIKLTTVTYVPRKRLTYKVTPNYIMDSENEDSDNSENEINGDDYYVFVNNAWYDVCDPELYKMF